MKTFTNCVVQALLEDTHINYINLLVVAVCVVMSLHIGWSVFGIHYPPQ